MAEHAIDLETWPRAAQYRLFRGYDRPHYATTVRIDATRLMRDLKPRGVSPYRASLYAIMTALHGVPELLMRFRGPRVVRHDRIDVSMTVPTAEGGFVFTCLPYHPHFATFDAEARRIIARAATGPTLDPGSGMGDAVAYLSCMPWMDYTGFTNAIPDADDCIPRVGWGRIVDHGGRWDMAMTLEVHHALVDGAHVGAFFEGVQAALDALGR